MGYMVLYIDTIWEVPASGSQTNGVNISACNYMTLNRPHWGCDMKKKKAISSSSSSSLTTRLHLHQHLLWEMNSYDELWWNQLTPFWRHTATSVCVPDLEMHFVCSFICMQMRKWCPPPSRIPGANWVYCCSKNSYERADTHTTPHLIVKTRSDGYTKWSGVSASFTFCLQSSPSCGGSALQEKGGG